MPEFPEDLFVEAFGKLVAIDQAWIPEEEGSALYIRPTMIATDEFIGVKPSQSYKFFIFTGPVGPYYPKPVRLWAETEYIRAAQGGTGFAKAAGNYAGALYPAKLAQDRGFDQLLWLDAKEFKYIQESGTMNVFFVINGVTITPPLTGGTILDGVTRDCILEILRSEGKPVAEHAISIEEVVQGPQGRHPPGSIRCRHRCRRFARCRNWLS
ncbi:MAG: aminotransferase class IV [Candidatus Competibacter sp.]